MGLEGGFQKVHDPFPEVGTQVCKLPERRVVVAVTASLLSCEVIFIVHSIPPFGAYGLLPPKPRGVVKIQYGVTCPPVPSNIVAEVSPARFCRFAFI